MPEKKDDFEYMVLKRIPLSKGISTKISSSSNFDESIKKLEKIEVIFHPLDKKLDSDFKTIKKINLFEDTKDIINLEDKIDIKENFSKKEKINYSNLSPVDKKEDFFNSLIESKEDKAKVIFKENSKKETLENKAFFAKDVQNYIISDNHNEVILYKEHSLISSKDINYFKQLDDKTHLSKNITTEINLNSKSNNSEYVLKNILDNLDKPIDKEKKDDFFEILESKDDNLDILLEELNKKTSKLDDDVYLEVFSFLDSKPIVKKVNYSKYNVKNLYSKIDSLSKEVSENKSSRKENKDASYKNLFEEIDIPNIYVIDDNVRDINEVVDNNYFEKEDNLSYNKISIEKEPNFIIKEEKVISNKPLNSVNIKEKKKDKFDLHEFNLKIDLDDKKTKQDFKNLNFTKKDDDQFKYKFDILKNKSNIYKDFKEKGIEYILPKDVDSKNKFVNKNIVKKENLDKINYSSLVFTDPIFFKNKDIEKINEEYSIDDFTYVKIYYDHKEGLFYNIIQPEMTFDQEKDFLQIKSIFLNTIDQDYYSFNKEQHNIEKYIQKIYDISVDKYSKKISDLDRKLFFKFIKNDFFGLGILTNLLLDKKILEVNCSGEKSNISVYHIDYGLLKTNLFFKNIPELNNFVLKLTKNMGLYITPAHPVINGYLPNGYKVEGIYSLGDTSSKGSSFVIKKYLESPQTPISLINTGVGSIDLFTYIWSAILEDYKIIISGIDDSFRIFNSLLLFFPDKKIITVQEFDRLKLPQRDWINKLFSNNVELSKKMIISQAVSQKPDYLIVDFFSKDLFENTWYNVNMFSITSDIKKEFLNQLKIINQKAIIINIEEKSDELKNMLQITSIIEINDKKQETIIEIDNSYKEYTINLLSSTINITDYYKRKKILRWMKDSKIYDYKDFNSIVSEFYFKKDDLFKRLDIN